MCILSVLGFDTGGGDAHLSCDAHHVDLSSPSWPVWIQRACHHNAIAQLPEDGNLSYVTSITIESSEASDPPDATTESGDPYDAHLAQSFVPIATRSLTDD